MVLGQGFEATEKEVRQGAAGGRKNAGAVGQMRRSGGVKRRQSSRPDQYGSAQP